MKLTSSSTSPSSPLKPLHLNPNPPFHFPFIPPSLKPLNKKPEDMYSHNRNQIPYEHSTEFPIQFTLPTTEPLFLPPLAIPTEHDSLSALRSEMGGYTSSGCSSYGGSPSSITYSPTTTMFQRSISSHSLPHRNLELYSPPINSDSTSFRKVLSTGDLQHNQVATESSIIESMNRASPYSPEEKKERIERYRSKRNLRNFNKKIKYECRKTLADSRPRIRGRFARNDEIEKMMPQGQWDHAVPGVEEDDDEDDDDNWIHFLDAFSANLMP